jgi:hypothetical protein
MEKLDHSYIVGGNHFGRQFDSFWENETCTYHMTQLLGINHREIKKIYVCEKTCTQMFIAALLVTAKNWKQPKYP